MAEYIRIHPKNPQHRLIKKVVDVLKGGGIIAYPTDTSYALGCTLDNKKALDRIRAIRRLEDGHEFSIICENITQVSQYIKLSNEAYRLIKHCCPGPYTFILPATKEVPRRLKDNKRKAIGLRIPDCTITQHLLHENNEAIYTTTLQLPVEEFPSSNPDEVNEKIGHALDLIIDAGHILSQQSTIVDMTSNYPEVIREGLGEIDFL